MKEILFVILLLAIAIVEILILIRLRYDRIVKKIWRSLKSKPTNTIFTQEMVAELDEPVQRYFLHAIAPGTPLATCVELEMSGSFQLKPESEWLSMQASEMISTSPGFIWKATLGKGLGRLSGADYFNQGKGRMRFSFWGLIPLVDAQNDNITRSSSGRLAAEDIWLPSALLPQNGVNWHAIANNTIQANLKLYNEFITLTFTIDAEGKLLQISLMRWGDQTKNGNWQYILFGGEIQGEKTVGGYTIPAKMIAGWWFGQDQYWAFFQSTIEQAKFS